MRKREKEKENEKGEKGRNSVSNNMQIRTAQSVSE